MARKKLAKNHGPNSQLDSSFSGSVAGSRSAASSLLKVQNSSNSKNLHKKSDWQFYFTASLCSIIFRCLISLSPHSGQNSPPMYGDYEAQRHWQEITYHLSPVDWYVDDSDLWPKSKNNLTYWGLDYPPLTAYHSFFNGWMADKIFRKPEWVALKTSHGYGSRSSLEDTFKFDSFSPNFSQHKIFMRLTVLVIDLAVYFPAAYILSKFAAIKMHQKLNFVLMLNLPFLLFVDYGHFQYNGVSLGLFLLALTFLLPMRANYDLSKPEFSKFLLGSFFFMSSILYKQMNLYFSLPTFFYLLAKIFQQLGNKNYVNTFWLGFCIVTGVFLAVFLAFLPWLLPQKGTEWLKMENGHLVIFSRLETIFQRVFPVGRGIFEDKVASFWCSLNNVVKIKTIFDNSELFQMATCLTLGLSLPLCFHLFYIVVKCRVVSQAKLTDTGAHNLQIQKIAAFHEILLFKYLATNVSLIFFLCSYHVHEKTILLPGLTAFLSYGSDVFGDLALWFSDVACFSLLPLFMKERNVVEFIAGWLVFVSLRLLILEKSGQVNSDSNGSWADFILKYSRCFSNLLMVAVTMGYWQ